MYLKGFSGMSNSIDPDQMPRYLIFDLGLHSLLRSVCPKSVQQEGSTYLPWAPGIIPPPLCLSVSLCLSLSLSLSSLSLHENMLRYILETLLVAIFIDTKIVSACLRACVRAIHTRTRERAHAHTQAC